MNEILYLAELDENDFVINIIACGEIINSAEEQIEILCQLKGHNRLVQYWPDGQFRRQPAAIYGKYDRENDVFVDPKPQFYPSWVLENGKWVPPIAMPGRYNESNWPSEYGEYTERHGWSWDEESISWVFVIY